MSKVEAIFLLHLSDGNSDAERFKREVMELTGKPTYIAWEGQALEPAGPGPMTMGPVGGRPGALCIDDELL